MTGILTFALSVLVVAAWIGAFLSALNRDHERERLRDHHRIDLQREALERAAHPIVGRQEAH